MTVRVRQQTPAVDLQAIFDEIVAAAQLVPDEFIGANVNVFAGTLELNDFNIICEYFSTTISAYTCT